MSVVNMKSIYFGDTLLRAGRDEVTGGMVDIDGEKFYRISNFDKMPAFFMSIVSHSDHWMFVSSKGGITCGRQNPENALFPYYTDDKIHDGSANTGPKSIFIVGINQKSYLWEPFAEVPNVYDLERNIFKNHLGNKLVFEEVNHSLKLKYRYAWMNSEKYGFVKHSEAINLNDGLKVQVNCIDGLQNILPYGVSQRLQSTMSTLVDGYKKCEIYENSGLGIFTLSSILTDKAEPSEALKATTVWSEGLPDPRYLISDDQFEIFRRGSRPETETKLKGRRGGYFVSSSFILDPEEKKEWIIVADVSRGPSDVPAIEKILLQEGSLGELVIKDIQKGSDELWKLVSSADGNQVSKDDLTSVRHYSNTLFNVMRGGILPADCMVDMGDVMEFFENMNSPVLKENISFFEHLGGKLHYEDLLAEAKKNKNPDVIRLCYEYLPLSFSRRHGDPSRPWNQFSIDIKKEDGSKNLNYQGNWRDIFQNWEALALSYPVFIESFLTKFVNASTADGYNPYRITRDGINWEVLDTEDPWSNIGYWGDHQIIYLLKFVQQSRKYHPHRLFELLTENIFSYANVPYRIKPYSEIVKDPWNSISYDTDTEKIIAVRVDKLGFDGKLLLNQDDSVLKVNLSEKILVSLLAKLVNFVPEGGIWMNTQRPEWNDANNALAGTGLSMVTLYHLRGFVREISELYSSMSSHVMVSEEVAGWFGNISDIFSNNETLLEGRISDESRRNFVDLLGRAGSMYRRQLYEKGFSGERKSISVDELAAFFNRILVHLDHSIRINRRQDGLYHSYNLAEFGQYTCSIMQLHEMLEGQVAILNSGYLDARESLDVLNALRASRMYRLDQGSYTLYPDRELPKFMDKNIIPGDKLHRSAFLVKELKSGNNKYVEGDINGNIHFNGTFRNAVELRDKLESSERISPEEIDTICNLFLECFNHKEFTGRSGAFYKYEGLGCIYWHMVSKLLLAVQEVYLRAEAHVGNNDILSGLEIHYRQIKKGLGLKKSPDLYGAFPTDPYSHTPGFSGVQQPGLTGQVKEDIISRFGEVGVMVENGCILFNPRLITNDEYLDSERDWRINGRTIKLGVNEFGFSFCGTPVVYRFGNQNSISIKLTNGGIIEYDGIHRIDQKISKLIFERREEVKSIRVTFNDHSKMKH